MLGYIIRRLLLIIPTLIGIMVVNFVIVQVAPGGPVEQLIAQIQGTAVSSTARFTGSQGDAAPGARSGGSGSGSGSGEGGSQYRGARGLDPAFIKEIETLYGFDKPMHERFIKMMGDYLVFDFGGGTLDVSIVLIEEEDASGSGRRCRVLGKAGRDGMIWNAEKARV